MVKKKLKSNKLKLKVKKKIVMKLNKNKLILKKNQMMIHLRILFNLKLRESKIQKLKKLQKRKMMTKQRIMKIHLKILLNLKHKRKTSQKSKKQKYRNNNKITVLKNLKRLLRMQNNQIKTQSKEMMKTVLKSLRTLRLQFQ